MSLGLGLSAWGQQHCGTMTAEERAQHHPGIAAHEERRNAEIAAHPTPDRPPGGLRVIPTVVHLIQMTPAHEISDDRVQSQIDVLNEDFRKLNADTTQIPLEFQSVAADCQIQFCLAKIDPNGCPTNGINRVVAPHLAIHGIDDEEELKSYVQWDPHMYLNIWVPVNLLDNLLGYATFPTWLQWDPGSDGVVINGNHFGRGFGTPSSTYNLGRTGTHEVGHWLGLYHTFDGGCAGTTASTCLTQGDRVCDTPPTSGAVYGCPPTRNTCTESPADMNDQTMNYMDYTDDACMYMFSYGQLARIQDFLDNERSQIWSAANLTATGCDGTVSPGCLPVAAFTTEVANVCVGDSVRFTDMSTGPATGWAWTFQGGSPATSSIATPAVAWATPGTYAVSLIASNGIGADTVVQGTYVTVVAPRPGAVAEDFEALPGLPLEWYTTDEDQQGSWEVSALASSGFGSQSIVAHNYSHLAPRTRDELVTHLVALDAQPSLLTFDYAYKRRGSFVVDSLQVLASTDCGATWDLLWQRAGAALATTGGYATGAAFVPAATDWRADTVDLQAYAGQSVRILFRSVGGNSQDIYLDNINLSVLTAAHAATVIGWDLEVYPNPAGASAPSLSLRLGRAARLQWCLRDLRGQAVARGDWGLRGAGAHDLALDEAAWGNLGAGMYLLEVGDGKSANRTKLVVKAGH